MEVKMMLLYSLGLVIEYLFHIKFMLSLGSTGAIHKLVNILHLSDEENRKKYIIFISAFEHHSNILPWKETGIEVNIEENKNLYEYFL